MALSDGEGGMPPSRRSKRNKGQVNYDENVASVEEEKESTQKRGESGKLPTDSRPRLAADDDESISAADSEEKNESEGAENLSDYHEDDVSAEDAAPARKRKRSEGSKIGRGTVSNRTCPHCDKVCVSTAGLKYHIDRFVCRPELKPPEDKQQKHRKRAKKGTGARGPAQARTCPKCKRVFTSPLGMKYHLDHNVCEQEKSDGKSNTLKPGSKYVTQFGVVEIVSDNRGQDAPQQTPKRKERSPKNVQIFQNLIVKTRVRRDRLLRLYQKNRMDQRSVFKVYFGGDPRQVVDEKPKAVPPPSPETQDLNASRIVECVLIRDERTFVKYDDELVEDEAVQASSSAAKSPYGAKLFLRRSLLEEKYYPNATVHVCGDCGAEMASRDGYRYHTQSKVCLTRNKKRAEASRKQLQAIEKKLEKAIDRQLRPDKKKARKDIPVYPEVWIHLGFEFLSHSQLKREEAVKKVMEDENFNAPDDVLARLRNELRRDRDRQLGTMYPGVFESLCFCLPKPAWLVERRREKEERLKEHQERRSKRQEWESPKKPPPHIIDIQVLADEADSGRYPSIKRYPGEHHDVCAICKQVGNLFLCDFCPKVVHLKCIRTKHTIKDPEPQDDFMCHTCIQTIMQRRNRAEKRRIMKQKAALRKSGQDVAAAEAAAVSGTEPVFESEYHAVAALGHELRDITELLSDAKARLRQAIGVFNMNNTRKSLLEL